MNQNSGYSSLSAKMTSFGSVSKPCTLVNIKIAGKWMFIPLKMVLGIDPYPFILIIWNAELVNTQNRTSPCLQVHRSSQKPLSRCSSRIDDQQLRVAAQAIQETLAEAAICSPTDAEAAWETRETPRKKSGCEGILSVGTRV